MDTILLGEAPKHREGYAFDVASWSTQQIAAVLGVPPFHLNRIFWLENIFENRQLAARGGFDQFSVRDAVGELEGRYFKFQRVICVGTRVARAMEVALGLRRDAIPENRFARFDRTARGKGWELARIPHPSSLREQSDAAGLVLPQATRLFLRTAAGRGRQVTSGAPRQSLGGVAALAIAMVPRGRSPRLLRRSLNLEVARQAPRPGGPLSGFFGRRRPR